MADRRRVPQKDSLFNQYIQTTTAVLEKGTPSGAVRLDLLPAQAAKWIAFRDEWMLLYAKYIDPAQRTVTIKNEKNNFKKDFKDFAEMPLKRISVSNNITEGDRAVFNLKKRKRTRTPKSAITDIPFGTFNSTDGGTVEIRSRRETEAGRGSMHSEADAIELRYLIMNESNFDPNNPPTLADCPHQIYSKRAFWRMNLGYANRGKRLVGFLRWVNLRNQTNNGGWCEIITTVI